MQATLNLEIAVPAKMVDRNECEILCRMVERNKKK
jgi:hypothetical protein